MNKTSLTLALAVTAATLLTTAPAQAAVRPVFGSFAAATSGTASGGEGSFNAMSNTGPNYSKYAYSWGMASLGDGTLHAGSSAAPCPSCQRSTGGTAVARYWDTVTFKNGQNLGLAEISLSIDGTLTPNAWATARYYFGSAAPIDFFQRLDYWAPATSLTSGTTMIGSDLTIPLGESSFFVFVELSTNAVSFPGGSNASADFGNTLHFNWKLPDGVTYSSASGQFMTAAVPEPSTWALSGAGLLLLGWMQRRRRAA